MEPFLLTPTAKDYLWGGNKLKTLFGKDINITPLAETWECSVHSEGKSLISSGKFCGRTLNDVLLKHPEYIGNGSDGTFPILIKFIDASKDLSVQVHPSDEYARINEGDNGKNEMWYILDAEPDASIVYGFSRYVDINEVRSAVNNGTLSDYLRKIPVKKGDAFYIKSGTVHAIGAGCLIAEIQENSNVTYRVYDYGRLDKNGNMRPLHIDKAIDVMSFTPCDAGALVPITVSESDLYISTLICDCEYFRTEKVDLHSEYDFFVNSDSFAVLLCISGEFVLKGENFENTVNVNNGRCLFIPASIGLCTAEGEAEFLKITCNNINLK